MDDPLGLCMITKICSCVAFICMLSLFETVEHGPTIVKLPDPFLHITCIPCDILPCLQFETGRAPCENFSLQSSSDGRCHGSVTSHDTAARLDGLFTIS